MHTLAPKNDDNHIWIFKADALTGFLSYFQDLPVCRILSLCWSLKFQSQVLSLQLSLCVRTCHFVMVFFVQHITDISRTLITKLEMKTENQHVFQE